MKVVFDTNIYVSEAIVGGVCETVVAATLRARWRVYVSGYIAEECERVIGEKLNLDGRFAALTHNRILARATIVVPTASRHHVTKDPKDTPVLQTAIEAGADYLVTGDRHLLALDPYEGIRIITIATMEKVLKDAGLL